MLGILRCHDCKKFTKTDLNTLKIIEKEGPKMGLFYSLNGKCNNCDRIKIKRIGKSLPDGYTLNSTSDQLKALVNNNIKPIEDDDDDEIVKGDKHEY